MRRPRRIAIAGSAQRHRVRMDAGFVYLGRAKICRYNAQDGSLEFWDKSHEAKMAGSRVVRIPVQEFIQELTDCTRGGDGEEERP